MRSRIKRAVTVFYLSAVALVGVGVITMPASTTGEWFVGMITRAAGYALIVAITTLLIHPLRKI